MTSNPQRNPGPERGPSPDPEGMIDLKSEERHALLVTVLRTVVPWVTTISAVGFLVAWVVSLIAGAGDGAALTMSLALGLFAGYGWATRIALRGQDREGDPQP